MLEAGTIQTRREVEFRTEIRFFCFEHNGSSRKTTGKIP
jgi:hypothetical protein